jgi:iron complex transport system ATP-binding protein
VISLSSIDVLLGTTHAVQGLTLSVPAEGWLALVGPNGAGKTTVLRCLADLVRYRGFIEIDGIDIAGMGRRDRARTVAYVPQQPVFPADMSAADYVLLGRTAHTGRFGSLSARDRAVGGDLLRRLDLHRFAGRRIGALSGGERQRLVLARALAQEAPVLVLDEPTSALDLGRRVDALELVDDLRLERGLTIVSVVHDLTLAGQFADHLALMDRGRLVAHGTASEVLTPDVLRPAFGAAVRVIRHAGDLVVMSQRPQAWTERSPA